MHTRKILATKEDIPNAIYEHNKEHYSKPEKSTFGLGEILRKAVGPHGTSQFSDRVPEGTMTEEDRVNINYQEAYELLEMMKRQDVREEPSDPT